MPFHQDCPYSSRRRPGEVNRHRQGQQTQRASCGAQGSRGGSSDGLCLAVTERRRSPAETAPALQETPGESYVPCPWHARLLQHRSQPGRHQRAGSVTLLGLIPSAELRSATDGNQGEGREERGQEEGWALPCLIWLFFPVLSRDPQSLLQRPATPLSPKRALHTATPPPARAHAPARGHGSLSPSSHCSPRITETFDFQTGDAQQLP